MIDWSSVSPVLKSLIGDLALDSAVVPPFEAEWKDGARKLTHSQVRMNLTMKVTNVADVGEDEKRHNEITVTPPDGSPAYIDLQECMVGHRRFTLQVRVEALDHVPDQNNWCWAMMERIRTRLKRTSSMQRLQNVNVALLSRGPAIDSSFKLDKRIVNAANMDCVFYAAFSDVDPVPVGWIEHVLLTSKVSGVDGELLPEPPNFTDSLVPPADE